MTVSQCRILLILLVISGLVGAQTPIPAPPVISASSHILQDFHSGKIITEHDANTQVEPASITKLMTAYIAFDWIANGSMQLGEMVTISEKAWRTPGSRMFIEVDSQVSVENLLKGMIIQSGNDASVALAEHIASSEESFADLMNQYAQRLGMDHSHFRNATGLPAEGHLTTAADIAKLARAMIADFPEYYAWYSEKSFSYNDIDQHNRNTLLWRDATVDGLKTGHTDSAGYCLASSAKRGNMRLISVVMGSRSEKARADESQKLLNYGFRFFETHHLYNAGHELAKPEVWKGEADAVSAGLNQPWVITIPRGGYDRLDAQLELKIPLVAPLQQNDALGTVRLSLDGEQIDSRPIVALQAVPEGGLWTRFTHGVSLWFDGLFD